MPFVSEPSTTDTNATPETLNNAQPEATNVPVSTEVKILTSTPDTVLDIPATAVTVQFAVGSQVELKVNGVAVDSSLIGRTEIDDSTKLVTQTWYGVGFQ